jgi:hypothetical protein
VVGGDDVASQAEASAVAQFLHAVEMDIDRVGIGLEMNVKLLLRVSDRPLQIGA